MQLPALKMQMVPLTKRFLTRVKTYLLNWIYIHFLVATEGRGRTTRLPIVLYAFILFVSSSKSSLAVFRSRSS